MTHVVLEAKRVWYYSEYDEAAFFEWLDKLDCIEKYEGQADTLRIHIDCSKVDESGLRELLSLFKRYEIDMKPLRVFDIDQFASWFRDRRGYWFESVFKNDNGSENEKSGSHARGPGIGP